MSYIGRNIVE
ncbi:hypothetical protein Zm00014a_010763 [Zea mays]|uniref:Uncharacterized protein n=1 Tax=Zea mays TaxID=4577 RepID=A0A3L6ESJ0_MAIZE|nr:hypothetical protein Zm00014a_010763 [Zea mays]